MTEPNNADNEPDQQQPTSGDEYPSLETLVRGYLDARGKDNVAQVAVGEKSFKQGLLVVTASTEIYDDLPAILEETDIVTHQGCEYELVFEEHAFGPTTLGYITLYASDTIQGMEPVSLEDGLAAADDHIQDITDDEEHPRTPTISE
jgi:hypothetical protein